MFGRKKNNSSKKEQVEQKTENAKQTSSLSYSIEKNMTMVKDLFENDETLRMREFDNKWLEEAKCCIFYFEGMVNVEVINENIIQPILNSDLSQKIKSSNLLTELQKKVLIVNNVTVETDLNKLAESAMSGDCIFFLDGFDQALIINSKGWQTRSIQEPESARVVRGPREGFNESIMMNISLIRRKIKSPELKFQFKQIGTKTNTKVCICYVKSIAQKDIIKEVKSRLDAIDIDGIIDSGYIQELIRDAPFSPFETVGFSERPDVVAAKLLEGRIAILVDGSPAVLTVPYIMIESVQSNEDYYTNYIFSSINRLMRSIATLMSISVPSIYLALVTFHQEMLPTSLLLSISAARKGVPIPTALSMFIMLLVFDALREAGTRMPAPIGQAVNIVGTLVLGQAAVEAKLVSAPVIIVTALSGILTLMNLNMIGPTVLVRSFLLLLTSVLGIYGYILGVITVILHVMSIRSFGVPYMLNLASALNHNFQDTLIRAPWWEMKLRPKIIAAKNLTRQKPKKRKIQKE